MTESEAIKLKGKHNLKSKSIKVQALKYHIVSDDIVRRDNPSTWDVKLTCFEIDDKSKRKHPEVTVILWLSEIFNIYEIDE